MQIETHQMDPRIARIHYLDYKRKVQTEREARRKALHEEAKRLGKNMVNIRIQKTALDKEDDELIKAYREMSLGKRILLLHEVMKKAGVDKHHLPRLAICRADAEWCWCTARRKETTFSSEQYGWKDNQVTVHGEVFPAATWNWEWRKQHGHPSYPVRALVPKIPPTLRPAGNLAEYHILWEAVWENMPPVDPILLKRVSETVFVVLAQWDLTPLERATLESR